MSSYPDGTLVLRDVQRKDSANYTCKVNNPHGDDHITYTLIVQGTHYTSLVIHLYNCLSVRYESGHYHIHILRSTLDSDKSNRYEIIFNSLLSLKIIVFTSYLITTELDHSLA